MGSSLLFMLPDKKPKEGQDQHRNKPQMTMRRLSLTPRRCRPHLELFVLANSLRPPPPVAPQTANPWQEITLTEKRRVGGVDEPPLSTLPTPPTTVHPRMGTSLPPGVRHLFHNLRCASLEKQQVVERVPLHPASPNNHPPLLTTPACTHLLLTLITLLLLHMPHCLTSYPPLLNPLHLLPKD